MQYLIIFMISQVKEKKKFWDQGKYLTKIRYKGSNLSKKQQTCLYGKDIILASPTGWEKN